MKTMLAVVLAQDKRIQMEHYFYNLMLSRARLFLQFSVNFRKRREKLRNKIVEYAETVVPLYSVDDFKDHFVIQSNSS